MLTERQLLIFKAIIDDFIASAQPIGSRTISEKEHITVSAATIRNVMAELEEMGYLEKTHTSSGRIPSEKGYRFYVDNILASEIYLYDDMNILKNILQKDFYELEEVVQMSAEILSDLTNYTTIILGPEIIDTKLEQLQIVTISKHTAVAILITNTGHVEHRSFTIPSTIKMGDLEKTVNILNERLHGVPIAKLPHMLNEELITLFNKYIENVDLLLKYLKNIFFDEQPVKLYIGGKSNMLRQPEFKDIQKIQSFYTMMENETEVANLLLQNQHQGIRVTIGNENTVDAIKDLSLITASYNVDHHQQGTIALIGPTRMEYKKVIKLLHALSTEMSDAFTFWYQDN